MYIVSGWSGGYGVYLNCFSASIGNQIWNFTVLQTIKPAVDEGYLYTSSEDDNFYALNASTGAQLWNLTGIGWIVVPAVAEGHVYFGGDNYTRFAGTDVGFVYALDASTGKKIWSYTIKGSVGTSVVSGDVLVFCSRSSTTKNVDWQENGAVYALKPPEVYASPSPSVQEVP